MTLSPRVEQVKPAATLAGAVAARRMRAQGIDAIGFRAGERDPWP